MKHLISLLAFSCLIGCDREKSNETASKDSREKKTPATEEGTSNTHTNKVGSLTETPAEKLTTKEVMEVMAWEIGTWDIKGRGIPVGGEPQAIEMTMEARWKERGKSVEYKFTLKEGGKTVSYFGHKKYDADTQVFIYRSKWGGNPETTSHERYNPKTRTFYSESLSGTPPTGLKSTAIHRRIGTDKIEQKLEVREGIQLVYSHETVSVRKGE